MSVGHLCLLGEMSKCLPHCLIGLFSGTELRELLTLLEG